jgi:hypothetical protein
MKYIEIDQNMEKTIHAICDAALKTAGMQAASLVNQLIAAIKDDGN